MEESCGEWPAHRSEAVAVVTIMAISAFWYIQPCGLGISLPNSRRNILSLHSTLKMDDDRLSNRRRENYKFDLTCAYILKPNVHSYA